MPNPRFQLTVNGGLRPPLPSAEGFRWAVPASRLLTQ